MPNNTTSQQARPSTRTQTRRNPGPITTENGFAGSHRFNLPSKRMRTNKRKEAKPRKSLSSSRRHPKKEIDAQKQKASSFELAFCF
ncbi:hypothetical protein ACFFU8_21760 [Chromobacterium piscinae]|uniref:hypothetical protein n=1 Tax=Chromobacterium piscinae TaxID=686831 RepID=UPI001E37D653|nr:hypothetical protein [Chromobacterium piscinae]MCD5327293.1 hypothetical protein [Chromobacterium piscinae]